MSAPFKKLLVPIDFSAHADEAIRVAADLARRYALPVTLLHVHEPPIYAVPALFSASQLNAMIGELEDKLATAKAGAALAGVADVRTMMLQGSPFERIVKVARDGDYDLIVMGTHGLSGVRHLLIGSVAEKVVRKAPCAVLSCARAIRSGDDRTAARRRGSAAERVTAAAGACLRLVRDAILVAGQAARAVAPRRRVRGVAVRALLVAAGGVDAAQARGGVAAGARRRRRHAGRAVRAVAAVAWQRLVRSARAVLVASGARGLRGEPGRVADEQVEPCRRGLPAPCSPGRRGRCGTPAPPTGAWTSAPWQPAQSAWATPPRASWLCSPWQLAHAGAAIFGWCAACVWQVAQSLCGPARRRSVWQIVHDAMPRVTNARSACGAWQSTQLTPPAWNAADVAAPWQRAHAATGRTATLRRGWGSWQVTQRSPGLPGWWDSTLRWQLSQRRAAPPTSCGVWHDAHAWCAVARTAIIGWASWQLRQSAAAVATKS